MPPRLSPPKTDRRDPSQHRHLRGLGRGNIAERGIHMVWAGAGDRHAIHHDLGTLVAQAMQEGNSGQFAVAMQADTGRIGQCIGAVMTRRSWCCTLRAEAAMELASCPST